VTARAWVPYVDGRIEMHVVLGKHGTLLNRAASLAEIRRLVAEKLDATADGMA
jgi:hypothetical protein